jgi:hypothetical protein
LRGLLLGCLRQWQRISLQEDGSMMDKRRRFKVWKMRGVEKGNGRSWGKERTIVYVVIDSRLRANDLLSGSYDPASQWSLRCPIVCSPESAMTTAVGIPRTAFAGKKVKSDSTKSHQWPIARQAAVFRLSLLSEGNPTYPPPRYADLSLLASRPLHSNLFLKQELHDPSTSLFKVPARQHLKTKQRRSS